MHEFTSVAVLVVQLVGLCFAVQAAASLWVLFPRTAAAALAPGFGCAAGALYTYATWADVKKKEK